MNVTVVGGGSFIAPPHVTSSATTAAVSGVPNAASWTRTITYYPPAVATTRNSIVLFRVSCGPQVGTASTTILVAPAATSVVLSESIITVPLQNGSAVLTATVTSGCTLANLGCPIWC